MLMIMCNKQHLKNICSWIHEKVKQHWGWIEKSDAYKKSVYYDSHSSNEKVKLMEGPWNVFKKVTGSWNS